MLFRKINKNKISEISEKHSKYSAHEEERKPHPKQGIAVYFSSKAERKREPDDRRTNLLLVREG